MKESSESATPDFSSETKTTKKDVRQNDREFQPLAGGEAQVTVGESNKQVVNGNLLFPTLLMTTKLTIFRSYFL